MADTDSARTAAHFGRVAVSRYRRIMLSLPMGVNGDLRAPGFDKDGACRLQCLKAGRLGEEQVTQTAERSIPTGHEHRAGLTLIALQSGSNGNCLYVEGGGVSVLFDAGIGGREARRRLALHGREIGSAAAVILSHDHSDHTRGAGVLHRMFGLPLRMTDLTEELVRYRIGRVSGVTLFRPGDVLQFGGLRIETVPTPHDGAEGVAFVVSDGVSRLGILTDLGHVFEGLGELVSSLDAVFIESNYDAEMLEYGPYPYHLQDRIRGPGGHLSNAESAALLREWSGDRLRWVCLAHLSAENNRPELALEAHRAALGERLPIHLAGRHGPSGPFVL